eukprot:scaffold354131_cov28-Attheya_sp.AAC.1
MLYSLSKITRFTHNYNSPSFQADTLGEGAGTKWLDFSVGGDCDVALSAFGEGDLSDSSITE